MVSWMIHLRVAQQLYRQLDIESTTGILWRSQNEVEVG